MKGGCHRCGGFVEVMLEPEREVGMKCLKLYRCVNCGCREDEYMKKRREMLAYGRGAVECLTKNG